MKKPKDVSDLASRLASAASTPLIASALPAPASRAEIEEPAPKPRSAGRRKAAKRSTVPVFLRLSQNLYDQCDEEAIRRTKATGRGVTVQQVILDRLEGTSA